MSVFDCAIPEEVSDPTERDYAAALCERLQQSGQIAEGFLLAGFLVPGARVADCDLIVAFRLKEPLHFDHRFGDGHLATVRFFNLIAVIEIKSHQTFSIREGRVMLPYHGRGGRARYKNPVEQVKGVVDSLRNYTYQYRHTFFGESGRVPYFHRFVALPQLDFQSARSEFPDIAQLPLVRSNILFGPPPDLEQLARMVVRSNESYLRDNLHNNIANVSSWFDENYNQPSPTIEALRRTFHFIAKPLVITESDRRQVDALTRRIIESEADYLDDIGRKLILFKGKAGTGKTFRLLHIAAHLARHGTTATYFTFNHALAQDVRRLVTILQREEKILSELRVVTIAQVVNRLARSVASAEQSAELTRLAAIEGGYDDFYQYALNLLLDFCHSESGSSEVRELVLGDFEDLYSEIYLIDEGQDWQPGEIELMRWLVGSKEQLVVAIGPDQRVRDGGRYTTDWEAGVLPDHRRSIICSTNYRQLPALHHFNRRYSARLLNEEWSEAPSQSTGLSGGEVQILDDALLSRRDFWLALQKESRDAGNEAIDTILAEPSASETSLCSILEEQSIPFRDYTQRENRQAMELETDKLRLMRYESLRGLEGWCLVCRHVDRQFERLCERYRAALPAGEAEQRAYAQLRIAFSRPIARLLLTFDNPQSQLAKQIAEILEEES